MRIAKDSSVDTSQTGNIQTIPYVTNNVVPKGSLYFNGSQNVFYGIGNNGKSIPLSENSIAIINCGINPVSGVVTPSAAIAAGMPSRLYVANANHYFNLGGKNSITVIDTTTNIPVTTIVFPDGTSIAAIAINAAGTRIYAAGGGTSAIYIVDTATNTILGNISAGISFPAGIVINNANNTAYVSNSNDNTVVVIDLNTNMVIGSPITVGTNPKYLFISPPSISPPRIYCLNYFAASTADGTISVINTATNLVTATITGFLGPFGMAITPDGTTGYVTNFGRNPFSNDSAGTTISIVNLNSNTISSTLSIGVGLQPSGIVITPDARRAYFANFNSQAVRDQFRWPGRGTVGIIDLTTTPVSVISPTIGVDQGPVAITLSADGKTIYVLNDIGNTTNVIAL